jgi:CHAT domain-containing protein
MARSRGRQWAWHRLFHVCSTWRSLITSSCHYLDLRLLCTNGTPVKNTLYCWPDLPIVMRYGTSTGLDPLAAEDEDEIVAALQKPSRIHTINLPLTKTLLGKLATKTQARGSFLAMELLELSSQSETGLALPDQFLGGEAPRLHTLRTTKIAFPALPRLLWSAKRLVSLQLEAIPSGGYIPPGVLITALSEMDTLQMLHIHYLSPASVTVPNLEEFPQYSPKRVKLTALNYLEFYGDYQYLEYLLAGIDAPVKYIYITFFYDPDFRTLQLHQFITRLDKRHAFPDEATVCYSTTGISITFNQLRSPLLLGLRISCKQFVGQMGSLAEIYDKLLHPSPLFVVRRLDIYASSPLPDEHDDPDLSPFVDLLYKFGDVESLRVTKEIGSHVAKALVENMVLPQVREIYLEEHSNFPSARSALAPFIAVRQRDHRTVALHSWQPSYDRHPSSVNQIDLTRSESQQSFRLSPIRTAATDTLPLPTDIHISTSASFTDRNDPALMLEEDIQEMSKRFSHPPHTFAIQSLYQRAQFLLLSFIRNRQVKLDNAIEIANDLLHMGPKQIRQLELFRMLAFCYALGNQRDESVSMFEGAFQAESATTSERLNMAWWWATFARAWDHSSTTLAYQNTLSAMQSSLAGAFTMQLRPVLIGRLGLKTQIPLEYASYRIQLGQFELAVETIEQGKTLIWSEIYGLWPFVGGLRRANPDLADKLATVSEELATVNASFLAHQVGGSQLNEEESHQHMDDLSPMFNKRRRLLRKRHDVITTIKHLPGFEDLMEPIPFRTLQRAASRGPIIIINHCPWRCDILIVLHDSPPSHIPMTDGFYEHANNLASNLLESRKTCGVRSELYEQGLRSVLKELHERVGQPVINKLRELGIPEQSRIWWYPTSVFCSLPLHAMGPVSSKDGREQYFSDLYICSYTPSLYALIATATATPISDPGSTLLFVGRLTASPLSTWDMKVIRSFGVRATRLVFGNATRDAVINGLQEHGLVHFAYGSHRERGKPFDTALELDGGDRLALLDLVCARVPAAKLVVLAANATAGLVDGTDFVEGLSLAAAMQYYGFGSVVGTMWDFGDGGAEDLSLGFYNQIVSGGAGDTTSLAERSAKALQYTVQKLREKGVMLQRWVNWVHYGT